MRAKSPLNHHSHQPTKLRRLFLSSPPSSPSSVFSVKIVVLSKISTFSFITIALIDIFCIFAEDKLHSAEYSSKLDILRSFALSLQKISCTRQNIQASLIFYARLHNPYLNKKTMIMKSREYYISLILSHAEELKSNFGVKSLRLFGSVSRNEQKEGSDVDICVDMEPKMFLVVRLKRFLENLLECSVDIVRIHKRINPYLLKEIEHDGIYIIK